MKKRMGVFHILGVLVLIVVVFFIANNNPFIKIMKQNTVETLPDMKAMATQQYIEDYLDDLNRSGRGAYRNFLIAIDMVFPLSYSLLFSLILLFIRQRIRKTGRILNVLTFTPFLAGFLDITENFHILSLLRNYPLINSVTVTSLITVTSAKIVSYLLFLTVFVGMIIVLLADRLTLRLNPDVS